MIQSILVLGGGSAGLLAALSLRVRMRQLPIRLVYSREIGIIGVGEGSTVDLPRHLHGFLGLDMARFFADVRPTFKLGIHFQWGARGTFNYPFTTPITDRVEGLPKTAGFYSWDDFNGLDLNSALMQRGKAFARNSEGRPVLEQDLGYHIENATFVGYLEKCARANGIEMIEGRVVDVEKNERGVAAVRLESGARLEADLFIDASGFRSELLGRALEEPFISFDDSLFCDRAVAGGWERTDEPLLPYTTAQTMDAGWSWQIEHERHVNRGYVYSSAFISDADAEAEFRRMNPRLASTRIVKFRTGRYRRSWVGNVVAIGNSAGFVEPLEATALLVVCQQARLLALALAESGCDPQPTAAEFLNAVMARFWDEIRDFLAIHYRFNAQKETPFWEHCRKETALHGAERIVRCYQENGPTTLFEMELLNPTTSLFHLEGFYALLLGQKLPHRKTGELSQAERVIWETHRHRMAAAAENGMYLKEGLQAMRQPGWRFPRWDRKDGKTSR